MWADRQSCRYYYRYCYRYCYRCYYWGFVDVSGDGQRLLLLYYLLGVVPSIASNLFPLAQTQDQSTARYPLV